MELKVGIVRDERYLEHRTGLQHPEHPNRLKYIYKMFDAEFAHGTTIITPEPVTLENLELVHTPSYIKKVLQTAGRDSTHLAVDTVSSSKTYLAAWLAAGGCIQAMEHLLSGGLDACFALVRPPGHHALRDRAGGFCIFNNLGIAAMYALERKGVKRILIIDWDIHHGNAIQDLFFGDKRVLYVSSHKDTIFPFTGTWEETGTGEGEGYNVNLILPKTIGDADLVYVYNEVVVSAILRFKPDVIMVAAGFDLHREDIISKTDITENAFRRLTGLVLSSAEKIGRVPVLFSLEGGYRIPALVKSVREVLKEMTGPRTGADLPIETGDVGSAIVEKARLLHGRYGVWTDGTTSGPREVLS
ncbi:MAG: histone deacetylase [Pseudomonadota bacterium]